MARNEHGEEFPTIFGCLSLPVKADQAATVNKHRGRFNNNNNNILSLVQIGAQHITKQRTKTQSNKLPRPHIHTHTHTRPLRLSHTS